MDHESYHRLEKVFIEGYQKSNDKTLFLRLSHIPFEYHQESEKFFYLQSVTITQHDEVGQVSPAFGAKEIIHQILPHDLIRSAQDLSFTYVSREESRQFSLKELLHIQWSE